MSERPWYKRYPADFIAGTLALSLEEKGAYSIVLDLIYDRGGPIPDDPQWVARVCGCSTRKWNAIRQTLIDHDKIYVSDGMITNKRAEKQAENEAKERRKLAENGAKSTRKEPEKLAVSRENNGLAEKGLQPNPEARSQKPEKEITTTTSESSSPPALAAAADRLPWEALIREFDAVIEEVFGFDKRRPWPAGNDSVTAKRWHDAGLAPAELRALAEPVMTRRAEKGDGPPGSLSYLGKIVADWIDKSREAAKGEAVAARAEETRQAKRAVEDTWAEARASWAEETREALEPVREAIGPAVFKKWFGDAVVTADGTTRTVHVATRMQRDWIASNYSAQLTLAGLRLTTDTPGTKRKDAA